MFEFCNPEAESNMSLHKPRFEDTWFHLCRRFAASLFDITVGEAFVKYVVDLVARSPRHCCTFCRFWSRSHAQFYSNEVRARGQLLPRLFKRFWEYCKHPAPDFTLKTDTTMDPYALGLHNALRHPGMPIRAVQALRQELARSCFKTLHSANGQSLDTLHCLITGVAEKYLDTAANKKQIGDLVVHELVNQQVQECSSIPKAAKRCLEMKRARACAHGKEEVASLPKRRRRHKQDSQISVVEESSDDDLIMFLDDKTPPARPQHNFWRKPNRRNTSKCTMTLVGSQSQSHLSLISVAKIDADEFTTPARKIRRMSNSHVPATTLSPPNTSDSAHTLSDSAMHTEIADPPFPNEQSTAWQPPSPIQSVSPPSPPTCSQSKAPLAPNAAARMFMGAETSCVYGAAPGTHTPTADSNTACKSFVNEAEVSQQCVESDLENTARSVRLIRSAKLQSRTSYEEAHSATATSFQSGAPESSDEDEKPLSLPNAPEYHDDDDKPLSVLVSRPLDIAPQPQSRKTEDPPLVVFVEPNGSSLEGPWLPWEHEDLETPASASASESPPAFNWQLWERWQEPCKSSRPWEFDQLVWSRSRFEQLLRPWLCSVQIPAISANVDGTNTAG